MPVNKAPGPDGFTVEFYKAAWPVIGSDLTVAVQSFFLYGFLPKGINATILSLAPKQANAQQMKDFRPIACCNLLYKVISKIIANRLKTILPAAIEQNQCAFIKDRLLLENVLLATELVKDYHRPAITSRCAIKFDISKAFDTVKWSFIVDILRAMGLPDQFIHWVYVCISTASFSVSVNGDLEGFFFSSRGIRQGCSLSPYLYVIINDVLSKMLNVAALQERFGYHPYCSALGLTHLSFADDILVFSNGSPSSLRGILQVMCDFASSSGLHINVAKSSIYAAGRGRDQLGAAATVEGIKMEALPIRYLGLPLTTKSMTRVDYEPLLDKIRNRLLSWTNKSLTFAGRLQLVKSVITSIANFWCSVSRLPNRCLDAIERLCSAFIWSGSPHDTRKAKVAWTDVCLPKDEGGLGLRKLRDTSRVYALSLIWRLFSNSASLWVAWTRHYLLRHSSYWDAKGSSKGSWIWHKLLKLRGLAYQFLSKEIRDGLDSYFWFDKWSPMGALFDIIGEAGPCSLGIPRHSSVAAAANPGGWLIRSRCRQFLDIIAQIKAVPLPACDAGRDVALWKHSAGIYRPTFSAYCTWEQIREPHVKVPWSKTVWFCQGVPRYAFITWLAIKNRLSTGDRMRA